MGQRSVGKGAGLGLVAAVVFPPSLLAGIVGGGLLGALHRKSLGLNTDERNRIAAELASGKAALGLVVKPDRRQPSARSSPRSAGSPKSTSTEEAVAGSRRLPRSRSCGREAGKT